ncbi:hypothetical protein HMI54_000919 [Coelomomyces lativittatus]|nr:hypothetical protein HMI55_001370 [Coelomomyces lativittatus]KAJ1511300.1 hypothetical protein HMI54_000919 [Coelomomyces lativittatus]KAJ1515775.1 hypothetical protein HMI56_001036 [Coelomomyces lativittatus]
MPSPHPEETIDDCSVFSKVQAYNRCCSITQQFLHYYRYGCKRECTDEWDELKLCMKVKIKPKDIKEQMIREFHEKKQKKQHEKPSSLDVWPLRENKLENFPPVEGTPEKFNFNQL